MARFKSTAGDQSRQVPHFPIKFKTQKKFKSTQIENKQLAVIVAHLGERSLQTQEIRGLSPVIRKQLSIVFKIC